jgi:hypothetical protein
MQTQFDVASHGIERFLVPHLPVFARALLSLNKGRKGQNAQYGKRRDTHAEKCTRLGELNACQNDFASPPLPVEKFNKARRLACIGVFIPDFSSTTVALWTHACGTLPAD